MFLEAQGLHLSLGMSEMRQGSSPQEHGQVRGGRDSQHPERARALVSIASAGEGSYSGPGEPARSAGMDMRAARAVVERPRPRAGGFHQLLHCVRWILPRPSVLPRGSLL